MKLKKMICLVAFVSLFVVAKAEEGMWLPSLIGEEKLAEMQSKGLKLTAEDLYSVNQASLKDAIALLSGCTGEMISDKGLLLTNHHCGYGGIQYHSTVEHDYLTNGFSAMSLKEELPIPGYFASFLIRMEDVTEQINKGVKPEWNSAQKETQREANRVEIIEDAVKNSDYNARIESLYYANQYFLFVYETYKDVRLVVAPPSAIGKFGGDTDNWMWPRHTGDFCMMRVYASKENRPAEYAIGNVPYKPKKSLTLSAKGIKKGDFTFIYGYPARTSEYLISDAVQYVAERGNPHKVKLRTMRLDVMNAYQGADAAVRIKYAAKNAGVSNAWKKWIGEASGVKKLGVVAEKEALEAEFIRWAENNPRYKGVVEELKALYRQIEPFNFATDYYNEAFRAVELIGFGASLSQLAVQPNFDKEETQKTIRAFFKNYHKPIDEQIAKQLFREFHANVEQRFVPESLNAEELFGASVLSDSVRLIAATNEGATAFTKLIAADCAVKLESSFRGFYDANVITPKEELNAKINSLYTIYMQGLMEMQPDKTFYPDANSTLRIAYGKVDGFLPRDGVAYDHFSTIEGIMEKDNPEIYDYDVPKRLKELYHNKDYGRWGAEGTLPVAFIASNHTTGGNSGSPILNGNGELIGLNFDRCWESTMSDIKYDKQMCRNIAVDIRYVLFLVDKYAGAGYLVNEMNLVY